MNRIQFTCLILCITTIPGYNQLAPNNRVLMHENPDERVAGINNDLPTGFSETLDSVIHFEYVEGNPEPNISKWIYFSEVLERLDSVEQFYLDQILDYTSGQTVRYNYDEYGRISNVFKNSWNSRMEHLAILINEEYQYKTGEDFTRISNIEWRTLHDTSIVDFEEDYEFDVSDQLVDYSMTIPFDINPDTAHYQEEYNYDTNGLLANASSNLTEAGESVRLLEMQYQNVFNTFDLPTNIRQTSRLNSVGGWLNDGEIALFYDDQNRITVQTRARAVDTIFPLYERLNYTYDQYDNLISEVRYTSPDSINFQMADSILYYHTVEEEEEEEVDPETPEFILYPNPTNGILHIRSGIDSPSEIKVIDVLGKIHVTMNVESGVADIDLSAFPTGYYLIVLTSNSEYHTGKVLKY